MRQCITQIDWLCPISSNIEILLLSSLSLLLYLSIFFLNLSLSLRDRDRADTNNFPPPPATRTLLRTYTQVWYIIGIVSCTVNIVLFGVTISNPCKNRVQICLFTCWLSQTVSQTWLVSRTWLASLTWTASQTLSVNQTFIFDSDFRQSGNLSFSFFRCITKSEGDFVASVRVKNTNSYMS